MKRSRLRAKPRPPASASVVAARAAFKRATKGRRCVACGCRDRIEAHHIVRRQVIEREREDPLDAWRTELAVPVCHRCHERHTVAFVRIPRERLPVDGVALVEAWGLGWALDREYGAATSAA